MWSVKTLPWLFHPSFFATLASKSLLWAAATRTWMSLGEESMKDLATAKSSTKVKGPVACHPILFIERAIAAAGPRTWAHWAGARSFVSLQMLPSSGKLK